VDYDAVVVGAGPAGSAAAYDLASAGRSVLLLDRRHFPRTKACAGGLTVRTLRRLRYSVAPVVRQVCTDLVLAGPDGAALMLSGHRKLCAMTVRSELDHFCLERTRERGAEFRVVPHLERIEEVPGGVRVETSQGAVAARYLIGADGANSVVRRHLPGAPRIRRGFAIEANVRTRNLPPMTFDLGSAPYGYGWLFPKGDHVNVGLYTNSGWIRPGRVELAEYARRRLGPVELEQVVGHHVGLGARGVPASARIALVGDAAGFVDPIVGEGIHSAVASGQAAAGAVLAALEGKEEFRAAYERRVGPLLRDLQACRRCALRFYRDPDSEYRTLTSRLVSSVLVRGYARGMSLTQMRRWGALLALPPVRGRWSAGEIPTQGRFISRSSRRRRPTPPGAAGAGTRGSGS
jgi:geranylgeranyl reductase family protein